MMFLGETQTLPRDHPSPPEWYRQRLSRPRGRFRMTIVYTSHQGVIAHAVAEPHEVMAVGRTPWAGTWPPWRPLRGAAVLPSPLTVSAKWTNYAASRSSSPMPSPLCPSSGRCRCLKLLKRRWRCYTSGGEAPRSSLMRTLRRLALSTLTAPSSRHRLRKPTRVRLPLA